MRMAHAELRRLCEQIPPAEAARRGTVQAWAFKDALAHLAFWIQWRADYVERMLEGRTTPAPDVPDNETIFCEFETHPWEQIRDWVLTAHQRLITLIDEHGTEDFLARESHRPSVPVWKQLAGDGAYHIYEHLTSYYRNHGQNATALAMHQEAYRAICAIPSPDRLRGGPIYNIACVYALSGQPIKALNAFHDALKLDPELLDWSREDGDFRFLRTLPGFDELLRRATNERERLSSTSRTD